VLQAASDKNIICPSFEGPQFEYYEARMMDDSVGMGAPVEGVSNKAYLEYDAEVVSGVFCTGAND
jgi:hypothetical protein